MQSPSADATESERRARLLELEERQRRLQQLCEEALREDEEHQRVLEQLGSRSNGSFSGVTAAPSDRVPPPPPAGMRLPFSQSPDRALQYSFPQARGGGGAEGTVPLSSYTSRAGGVTAPYHDDLLTGEVQSFRDSNSVARASSMNTVREPSLPQPPPPPNAATSAAVGARPVFTLHDTRGRNAGPSYRRTPSLSPADANDDGTAGRAAYVRDRLPVGSGDRGYRRYPSNGMVDTPVYRSDAYGTDPAATTLGNTHLNTSLRTDPPLTGGASVNSGYRGIDDLFGSTTKKGPPPPPPQRSPSRDQVTERTPRYGRRRGSLGIASPPPPPPPAAVALPPPPPLSDGQDSDEDGTFTPPPPPSAGSRGKTPFLAPPTSAAGVPTTISGRRRALREKYGLRAGSAATRKASASGSTPPPPPPPPPGMVNSPMPIPPPPANVAGLFDSDEDDHQDTESTSTVKGWRDRLRKNDAKIRAMDPPGQRDRRHGARRGQQQPPPPPPPPPATAAQDEVNNKYTRFGNSSQVYPPPKDDGDSNADDPWERHSITPSMMSTEERKLDDFFNSPWKRDQKPNDRWRRERDALNAATTGRAPQPARRRARQAPPPPGPDDRREDDLQTTLDFSVSDYTAEAEGGRQRRPSYPNAAAHPYAGGSGTRDTPRQLSANGRHPVARPGKPPLSHMNANSNRGSRGSGGKALPTTAAAMPPAPSARSRPTPRSTESHVASPFVAPHANDDASSSVSGFTGRGNVSLPRPLPKRQTVAAAVADDDATAFFDEDPGKAALQDLLRKPPLAPPSQEPQRSQSQGQRLPSGSRGRSPSLRPTSVGATKDEHNFVVPASLEPPPTAGTTYPRATSMDDSSHTAHLRTKLSGSGTPVPPLPAGAAQAEIEEAKAKAEALARHLVKAMKDKKMLQENVEQLEELVEEANFEVGRLQKVVEEQHGESNESLGLQAALRAKEREIAVCEDEIKRLNNIVDAHVLRLAASDGGEDWEGPEGRDLVTHTAEMEAAMTKIGLAHMAQREAEEHAEQLSSELEAAVEQIRALDERLAEMERAAAAERLREVSSGLRSGSRASVSHPSPQQPSPHPAASTSLALPIPSPQETQSWPLSARQALAKVVAQAEGLLVQNSESSRHASVRVQHLEYTCEELQRRLNEKKHELHHLQDECMSLRKDKNTMRAVGDQWFKQLQEVKADAQLLSELVRTSRADAEDVVVSSKTADAHLDSMTRAASSPFARASPPSPVAVAALHEGNEQAKGFAQQVMRDMHSIARFLAALREMDIGEQSGYKILQTLASGDKPADRLYLTADDGSHSPMMVKAIATGQDAVAARVREKRDFVIRAVERALAGEEALEEPSPARRLELRRGSDSKRPAVSDPSRWDPYSRPDEWDGAYPDPNPADRRGDALVRDADVSVAASEVSGPPDGFEADIDHPDREEVEVSVPVLRPRQASVHPVPQSQQPAHGGGNQNAGLVASDIRGNRAIIVSDATLASSVPPLAAFHPPSHPQPQQPIVPSVHPKDASQSRGDDDPAPVARPLRLSSTPPERTTAVNEADMNAGATDAGRGVPHTRNGPEQGRRGSGPDERTDYTFVSSPSMSPPTFDRPTHDREEPQLQPSLQPLTPREHEAALRSSQERRRLQLSSPSRDRDEDKAPESDGQHTQQPSVVGNAASESATMIVSPATEKRPARTAAKATPMSPGGPEEDDDDDNSPHLARGGGATVAAASDSLNDTQRPRASTDKAPTPSATESRAEEAPVRRSNSPPITPVHDTAGGGRPHTRTGSPSKSKSASVDAPPPVQDAPRASTSSLPKERSTTAPPSSDHNRHKKAPETEADVEAPTLSSSRAAAPEVPASRKAPVKSSRDSSDSDYEEATLGFMTGGAPPSRPNVVQEVRVPEPAQGAKAPEPAKPRSVFNRIAHVGGPEPPTRNEHGEPTAPSSAKPSPSSSSHATAPTPDSPRQHTAHPAPDSDMSEEEVTELEERNTPVPAATAITSAPHAGRRMPGAQHPSTGALDNLDNISSINDSAHDERPRAPSRNAPGERNNESGSLHRSHTPVGDFAASAPPPLPPRLQRSVPHSGPASGNTSGRETPLERPAHTLPPQRRPSPNPVPPSAGVAEPTLPPALPQPQQQASALPRPGGPASRSHTPIQTGGSLPSANESAVAPTSPTEEAPTDSVLGTSHTTPKDQKLGPHPVNAASHADPNQPLPADVGQPPEVASTVIPSSRRGRNITSPDRYDHSGASSGSTRSHPPTPPPLQEHSTAFTNLEDDTPAAEVVIPVEDDMEETEPTTAVPRSIERREDTTKGGFGLPSAPASSADAILMIDPTNLPQPAAPMGPVPQSLGSGNSSSSGAGSRLPPRAGSRPQRQTTPEVASLPRVNLDDMGEEEEENRGKDFRDAEKKPVAADAPPRLLHVTTRGRSSSIDVKGSAPAPTPPPLNESSTFLDSSPIASPIDNSVASVSPPTPQRPQPDPDPEERPQQQQQQQNVSGRGQSPVSKVSSTVSTPRSSTGGSRLYDSDAMQKRKEDVARILQRLKEKRDKDGGGGDSSRGSATPSPPPQ